MPNPDKIYCRKLRLAKTAAFFSIAKTILVTAGLPITIAILLVAASCSSAFHLNFGIALCGTVVGTFILGILFGPTDALYKSALSMEYQRREMWDEADQIAFAEAGSTYHQIIKGGEPSYIDVKTLLGLSQVQLILVRKGEMNDAVHIARFLANRHGQTPDEEICNLSTLGVLNIELGDFASGVRLLQRLDARLVSEGRESSPSAFVCCLGLVEAFIQMRDQARGSEWLEKARERTLLKNNKQTVTDKLTRESCGGNDVELGLLLLLTGQLSILKGDTTGAELHLLEALRLTQNESVRQNCKLLFSDLLLHLSEVALLQGDYHKAAQYAEEAVNYGETIARYHGKNFCLARINLLYANFRCGGVDVLAEMEGALRSLQNTLMQDAVSPFIASSLLKLSEIYSCEGNISSANDCLRRALEIRRALFEEGDSAISEVENLLASRAA